MARVISAPEIAIQEVGIRYGFKAIGKTALLTHNPAGMIAAPGSKGPKRVAERIPEPVIEAEAGLYRDDAGHYCIPGVAVRQSIINAAGAYKVKRTNARSIIAHITIEPELLLLIHPETEEPLTEYKVDSRRAVVQRQGIVRSRPLFFPWAIRFEIVAEPELISGDRTAEFLAQIATDAGNRIGIGDYRPQKSGWFGRFSILRI